MSDHDLYTAPVSHPSLDSPHVVSLHKYPVKSMHGQQVEQIELDSRGCAGDRVWSIRTAAGKLGSGKTTQRFDRVPGLLTLRATERDGQVLVTFPDGSSCAADDIDAADRLTRHLEQPVTLVQETEVSHFDGGPVSLIGTASVREAGRELGAQVDPARFRGNLILSTYVPFVEEEWIGWQVQLGTAVLAVTEAIPRCVMVDAETVDLPAQRGVLTAVGRVNQARLGIVANVITPGRVAIGDQLRVLKEHDAH
jgi:uncharacterized protein YcbX